MRSVGTVLHAVPRDLLVVTGTTAAGPGSRVVDRQGKPVGVVSDVIGPVTRPYLVVRARGIPPQRLVGHALYTK